ncbi:MAG: mechanosensitive ion channel family protein [Acidimicrobiia bacterium]|nr:mechanosensitive ion channel family protein [Acidimicrobiia bacterium]
MLFQLIDACGEHPGFVCESVYDATESEVWARAAEWTVEKPIRVLVILAIAWLVNRLVRRAIDRFTATAAHRLDADASEQAHLVRSGHLRSLGDRLTTKLDSLATRSIRKRQRTETLGTVLRSLASAVIYTIAVLIVLGEFDINLGPFIAGAGIVGIALGFGAQAVVRDFLAGIFMLVEDQYGVGDIIDVGDATGVVEGVSLRTTRIRDVEGTVWFVPNGEIKRIGNKSQLWSRAVMDIEVAYDTDLGKAADVIKGVADQVWSEALVSATIIEEPEIWGVQDFGASAIAVRLVIKTEPGEQFAAAREIRGRLKAAFDAAGIDIPFPQRTVWLRRDEGSGQPSSVLHANRSSEEATPEV